MCSRRLPTEEKSAFKNNTKAKMDEKIRDKEKKRRKLSGEYSLVCLEPNDKEAFQDVIFMICLGQFPSMYQIFITLTN